jgi:hypothetical protein
MSDDRLRFRCYQCNQLLGAPPKKAGSVISCPRCKAELMVPAPEELTASPDTATTSRNPAATGGALEGAGAASPEAQPRTLPSFMEEIAAAIPDDLASLRPEDIRVEAEFVDLVVTTPPPVPPPVEPPPAPEPALPAESSPPAETSASSTIALVNPTPAAGPGPPGQEQALGAVLPQINIETSSILPRAQEIRAVHEVVLQPATVLAWSLLVLLSLPMAFLAGLLIGHFIWK